MYLEEQNKTWVKLFRGYHSHFTSNSRPYTEYGCSVNVQALRVFTPKWRKMQASSTLIIVLICLCILETLTCTLLPDNQDWQVTHVGRFRNCSVHLEADWERVLWFPFDRRGCGKWTYQGNPRAINSSSTSLRPFSSPGTLPGSCHCPGWSGSRQQPCFFTNETMITTQVFLEEMEGCHLFLSPPFVMHSRIRGCTKLVSPGSKDGLPLILSAGFRNPFGFGLVGSGFHSFRWAFALALQKLLLIVGLTTAIPFLGCSPEFIWQLPVLAWLSSALLFPWNFRCPLAVSCEALFPLLSRFRYIWKLRKVTAFSAIFARWHKNRTRKVASRCGQYSCHRYTPRKLSASRLPAPHQSLPDQESVPQIYSTLKGSFWQQNWNFEFSLLAPDSRYLQRAALKLSKL